MRFSGKVYKDGKYWLAEIPILDAMTQGKTKKEAYEMAVDMVETMIGREDFKIELFKGKNGQFEIGSKQPSFLISLLLQRKREISGMSLSQVAKRMGSSSRNAYARYEQGKSVPTIEKLNGLLSAVCPSSEFVINETRIM